jgi:TIR domain
MNTQLATARVTIAVYSGAYFASAWCSREWASALARKSFLPVRIEPVDPPETLRTLTWVDLFDLDENPARDRLLAAVGVQVVSRTASFPGRSLTPTDAAGPPVNSTGTRSIFDEPVLAGKLINWRTVTRRLLGSSD